MSTFNLKRNLFLDYSNVLLVLISYPINVLYKSLLTLMPFIIAFLSLLSFFDFVNNNFSFTNQNYIMVIVLIGLLFSTDIAKLFYYLDIFLEPLWKDFSFSAEYLRKCGWSENLIKFNSELDIEYREKFLYKKIKFFITNFQEKNLSNLDKHLSEKYEIFTNKVCFYSAFPLFLLLKLDFLLNT